MKTISIEVPESLVFDLMSIGAELALQNNRNSSWPVWYVSEDKKVYRSSSQDYEHKGRVDPDYLDTDQLCEACLEKYEEDGDIPDDCNACGDETFEYYDLERGYASYGSCFFLTEKACREYIEANSYHFNNPKPYCDSAFRNHELQPIIQALIVAAGHEVPSNHYGRVPEL